MAIYLATQTIQICDTEKRSPKYLSQFDYPYKIVVINEQGEFSYV